MKSFKQNKIDMKVFAEKKRERLLELLREVVDYQQSLIENEEDVNLILPDLQVLIKAEEIVENIC